MSIDPTGQPEINLRPGLHHGFPVQLWGRMPYGLALEKQRALNLAVQERTAPPTLVLVEHEPVITVPGRRGAADHVLASDAKLQTLGIAREATDRGGDVTYHGPGQLVCYPILRLKDLRNLEKESRSACSVNADQETSVTAPLQEPSAGRAADRHVESRSNSRRGLGLHDYLRGLELAIIQTLANFGIDGHVVCGKTGVWIAKHDGKTLRAPAKIAAIGLRVRRGVSMHGLAINVDPDLSHFKTIVPCGLTEPVTSFAALGVTVEMKEVQTAVLRALSDRLLPQEGEPPTRD